MRRQRDCKVIHSHQMDDPGHVRHGAGHGSDTETIIIRPSVERNGNILSCAIHRQPTARLFHLWSCSIDQQLQDGTQRFSVENRVVSLRIDCRTTLEHHTGRFDRETSSKIWGPYGCHLPPAKHTQNLLRPSRSKQTGLKGVDWTGIKTRRLRGDLCRKLLRVCGNLPRCRCHWLPGRSIERRLHSDRATGCHSLQR